MGQTLNPGIKLLLITVVIVTAYFSRLILLTALIGVGIGVLISPLLDAFKRWFKLRRGFGALLLILLLLIIVAIVVALFGWVIAEQAQELTEKLPNLGPAIREQLERIFERFPWILTHIKSIDYAGAIQKGLEYLFMGAKSSASAIGGVIFAIIIGVYLSVDAKYYFEGTVRAFPPRRRDKASELLQKSARVLRVWFRAQLIDMALIGVITTIGLSIVGVRYWALFGLLTAILGIIPYVGVMIVVVITSFITLASDASQVPWVLLVFFITQQIEGNVILPMVMKGQAEIPEALLIIVMLFFGYWFGLLGIFVAPPLVAVMICLYRNLYLPQIEAS